MKRGLLEALRQAAQAGTVPSRDQLQEPPQPTLKDQLEASLEARTQPPIPPEARAFMQQERAREPGLGGRLARARRRSAVELFGGSDGAGAAAAVADPPAPRIRLGDPPGAAASAPAAPAEEPPLSDEPFQFLSGPAGSGKTWLLRDAAARDSGCVLAATTGIASVNLGEGTTVNSLLRYYQVADLRDSYTGGFLEAQLKKLRKVGVRRILLDEISMLSGDALTIITRAILAVNEERNGQAEDAEILPEMGLVLSGDFLQLGVVPDTDDQGKKLPVVLAFESAEWARYAAHTRTLTHSWRQADPAFLAALRAVRCGDGLRALDYFGPRLQRTTDLDFPGPLILAKNADVDRYNGLACDKLAGPAHPFPSERWGKLRLDWGGPPRAPAEWGIPEALTLKEGARVMVLANRNIAEPGQRAVYAYINGDLGTFLGPEKGGAKILLDRTGAEELIEYVQRDNQIPIEPGRRKALKAEGHPERAKDRWEIIGGVTYMPLRLAYASTVHRSQSLSLDRVQVNLRDAFFRQPGLLYVALSRARTPEGLRIVGSPEGFRARCTVNPKVRQWL